MQFNNNVTQSGSFKLSVNKSSGISLDELVFRLPSHGFLDVSPSFELLLKFLVFELRSKNLEISCIPLTMRLLKSQVKYEKISSNNFAIDITKLI